MIIAIFPIKQLTLKTIRRDMAHVFCGPRTYFLFNVSFTKKSNAPAEPSPSPKYISLQLPYLGSISNNIWQELSSFIRHKAVVNVKLCCFQSTRMFQSWFSVKDRQALLNRFNVVYKLTCLCGASYIGQTQHNLIKRAEEHRTSLSSSVCRKTLASQPRLSGWLSQPWGHWRWQQSAMAADTWIFVDSRT